MITPQLLGQALQAAANVLLAGGAPSQGAIVAQPIVSPPPPPPQGQVTVTEEQLQKLIMPHVGNDAIKAELGNVMRAQGIAQLPDARPDQYGMLYSLFQGVLARFGVGGPAPQTSGNVSII